MSCYNIMAIIINNRSKNAIQVQELLSKNGCLIRMRLGLHDAGNVCSEEGLMLLQLCGEESEIKALEDTLNQLEGIKAKTMSISSQE